MATLYYLKTRQGALQDVLRVLKEKGQRTDVVRAEYIRRGMMVDDELICWSSATNQPVWAHRAAEKIVKSCGTEIEY